MKSCILKRYKYVKFLLQIYCKNMKKPAPEEFLSLPAGEEENFSEVYPFR